MNVRGPVQDRQDRVVWSANHEGFLPIPVLSETQAGGDVAEKALGKSGIRAICSTIRMTRSDGPAYQPVRTTFARACLDTRLALDLTQQAVADRAGVTRSYIARVERGDANPSIRRVEAIAQALGLEVDLTIRRPAIIGEPRVRDAVHARCSAYVGRRLVSQGWELAREVEIIHGRSHGWIDLLALDPRTRTLLVIEIKTRLDDLGAVERQLGWYERAAWDRARELGWEPRRVRPGCSSSRAKMSRMCCGPTGRT